MQEVSIFWFRRDLRLTDNHALYKALKSNYPVLCIFIFDKNILEKLEEKTDKRVMFIHQNITKIKQTLNKYGSDILTFFETPLNAFKNLCNTYQIKAVYTNTDYEPYAKERDQLVSEFLKSKNIPFNSFKDQCIFHENDILTNEGKPYTIFTPYMKKWKTLLTSEKLTHYPSENLLQNLFKIQNITRLQSLLEIGFQTIPNFSIPEPIINPEIIKNYHLTRDFPAANGTSKLSVHLRFGTISIRHVVKQILNLSDSFLNELIWREFYMMILFHYPSVANSAFKPAYNFIAYRNNEEEFTKWCQGQTGYPIVDAGMRELNATGYMHNRVRMIVASFLTKHLLIHWQWGEHYFAKKLLDFDLAANNGGWQWASGSGTDAAPYFRIFNPIIQAQKFDKNNLYIKKWVPEFGTKAYTLPIVEHKKAIERCLKTYKIALGN